MRPSRSSYALVALLVAGLCGGVAAESIDKSFHESFDVTPGARLHLHTGDGDVVLKAWDEPRIEIDVQYHYEVKGLQWGRKPRDFEVRFRQQGEDVYVEEDRGESGTSIQVGSVSRREHLYTISAPAWVELDIEGDDGDISVAKWDASIEIVCDDGDVEILDSRGPRFDFQMQDGDLILRRCAAAIEVEMDDGDVDFEQVSTQTLSLEAADGRIELELIGDGSIDWRVQVDDGDVRLRFAGNIDADVHIETDDGDIRVETSMAADGSGRSNRFAGRLGSGEGRLRLRAQDGDVTLRQSPSTQ